MKFATVRWFLTAVLSVAATVSFALSKHFEDVHVYYVAAQALFLNGRTDLYSADFADSVDNGLSLSAFLPLSILAVFFVAI